MADWVQFENKMTQYKKKSQNYQWFHSSRNTVTAIFNIFVVVVVVICMFIPPLKSRKPWVGWAWF